MTTFHNYVDYVALTLPVAVNPPDIYFGTPTRAHGRVAPFNPLGRAHARRTGTSQWRTNGTVQWSAGTLVARDWLLDPRGPSDKW